MPNPGKHESASLVIVDPSLLGNAPTAPSVPRPSLPLPLLHHWTMREPLPPPRLMDHRVWNILSSGCLADRVQCWTVAPEGLAAVTNTIPLYTHKQSVWASRCVCDYLVRGVNKRSATRVNVACSAIFLCSGHRFECNTQQKAFGARRHGLLGCLVRSQTFFFNQKCLL